MAKRTAGNQKTRDDGDSDEEQRDDPGARSTPLAPIEGRVIRGMPKRKGLESAAPSPAPSAAASNDAPATSSPFSGFSFGGNPAPSTTPFVFGGASSSTPVPAPTPAVSNPFTSFSFNKPATPASTPAAETSKPPAPAFGFGAKPSTPAAPASVPAAVSSKPFANFSFSSTPTAPAPAASASSTTPAPAKSFGFGTSSTTSSFTSSNTSTQPPAPAKSAPISTPAVNAAPVGSPATTTTPPTSGPSPSQSTPPPEGEVSYYTSLRGLNTSILSFLTSTLESDPFTNLAIVLPDLVKQYETHVDDEAKKAGWRPEGKISTATTNGESSKGANGTTSTFKMPAAPSAGGFALPKAPSANPSAPTPSFGGFTPSSTPSTTTSGFTFGGAKPSTTPTATSVKPETPKKPSAEVTKIVEDVISGKSDEKMEESKSDAPKPFTFGSNTSISTPESSKKGNTLFSFAPTGPLHPPTPESKTFSPSTTIENATPAKLGKFGPGGSQPQLAFGGAKSSPGQATSGTPAANKPFSFGFGAGSASTSTAPPPASSNGAAFGFGSSSSTNPPSTAAPSTFSFGSGSSTAAQSNNSNPFAFGGSSSSTSTTTTSFSFGAKPAAPAATPASNPFSFTPQTPKAVEEASGEADGNADSTPENAEPTKNLAETIGAGEENEDTVSEQRGKLHRLEGGEFKLEGLGQFKLKRSKNSDGGKTKRRLLMRTDGNGNVILNMTVNSSFNPTVEGSHVKFLGFDSDGKPVPYALRVKNAEVAKKLQEELQKEVNTIKGE
ncbi:uncharacterized protein IL334_003201 [Kwoniella shivajii]|uniref:RanBD1 domain-containing protein n=1 Tax=Kwoniella shivajii TaxID=564305 RepID=A0ABZ1CWW7_9TREE|nr:hypothetical protein IL334_003201 [Kwoniella shivajii]